MQMRPFAFTETRSCKFAIQIARELLTWAHGVEFLKSRLELKLEATRSSVTSRRVFNVHNPTTSRRFQIPPSKVEFYNGIRFRFKSDTSGDHLRNAECWFRFMITGGSGT